MVFFVASLLLGVMGSFMRPLPFVAALLPVLALACLAAVPAAGYPWLAIPVIFYGALALAEVAYVGALTARHWPRRAGLGRYGAWIGREPGRS